jgi:hypothetical protein
MSDLLTEKAILQFVTAPHSVVKASLAERGIQEIKKRISKMRFYMARTVPRRPRARWIDLLDGKCPLLVVMSSLFWVLPDAVASYNAAPHSSLGDYTPAFAAKPENHDLIMTIQNSRMRPRKLPLNYLRHGTEVRVRLKPKAFGLRASDPQTSEEILTVARVFPSKKMDSLGVTEHIFSRFSANPETYQLADSERNLISGTFYQTDLVVIPQ